MSKPKKRPAPAMSSITNFFSRTVTYSVSEAESDNGTVTLVSECVPETSIPTKRQKLRESGFDTVKWPKDFPGVKEVDGGKDILIDVCCR